MGEATEEKLSDVFGMWVEETDSLYDNEHNSMTWNGTTYELSELCEVIRPVTCETLAVYNTDFYKGTPALTVNCFGKGKAYHVCSNPGQEFMDEFCKMLSEEAGLEKALEAEIPENVSVTYRRNGEKKLVFVQNFGDTPAEIKVNKSYRDLLTEEVYDSRIKVDGFSAVVVTD